MLVHRIPKISQYILPGTQPERSPTICVKADCGTEIQTGDDLLSNQKADQYNKCKQIQLSIQILREKLQKELSGQHILK